MITRKRYIDQSCESTKKGIFITAFDVLQGRDVSFTMQEWEKVQYTYLTDEEFNQKLPVIKNYWARRKKNG
jgi:hypothetical protein